MPVPSRHLFLVLLAPGLVHANYDDSAEVTVLERFIASETSLEASGTMLPTSRPVDSVYGFGRELADTPRSVTVITPEALTQRGLLSVNDLPLAVPGATVINYFGMPGVPTTRGLLTGIYFNGMQRVWNRNGYPTSFGSLESMDYVRGPAPGTYGASSPGGYVNFIPKSPFFDRARGSMQASAAAHGELRAQIDVGGPRLIGSKAAAYRVSLAQQQGDTWYDGVKNDYFSAYGSLKLQWSDRLTFFTGGEFYRHRANENPGWNRVTQDLIDHQSYLVGSPVNDLTAPSLSLTLPSGRSFTWLNTTPGAVNRAALESATPFGGTRGTFAASFFALQGFTVAGFRPALVASRPDAAFLYRYLGALDNPTGETVRLSRRTVLSDAVDFADADTYLFFFDTIARPSDTLRVTHKLFLDAYTREKVSSYGYGELGKNLTLETKLLLEQQLDVLAGLNLAYGASARYEDSLSKTEFTVEPFSRRDLTRPPTPNDTLFSGGQRDSLGRTFWDPMGSWESRLFTAGLFLTPELRFSERFSLLASARWDNASWSRAVPFGLGSDFNSGRRPGGGLSYTNFSVSPVWKPTPASTLYLTLQRGTAFQGFYVSGSVDRGDTNFQESSLAELGWKLTARDGDLFLGLSLFYQGLVNFDVRAGAAVPQRGRGIEFEAAWQLTPALSLNAQATYQEHHYRTATIPGGFVPLTAEQMLDYGGIFYADYGGRPNPGGRRFGIPPASAGFFLKYQWPNGLALSGGPCHTSAVWGNPDKTLRLPAYTLWTATVSYVQPTWELRLSGANLADARYFHPVDAFAANAIIQPGEGRTLRASFTYKF